MSILNLKRLRVSYSGINALKGIDLHVKSGEMVALIGANGAGKTTTLKAISGLVEFDGEIMFDGVSSSNMATHALVERGLSLVPEGRGVFSRLTVYENLEMGAYIRSDSRRIIEDIEKIYNLFPILFERKKQTAGTLSGGEQQMLAIGRALMSQPKLLLLDEPSMGLAPLMVEKIFEVIQQISQNMVSVLLVEQNAMIALGVAERGYVMASGEIILSGQSDTLLKNPEVRKAYLGE